jgi:hypothetical protein
MQKTLTVTRDQAAQVARIKAHLLRSCLGAAGNVGGPF